MENKFYILYDGRAHNMEIQHYTDEMVIATADNESEARAIDKQDGLWIEYDEEKAQCLERYDI